MDKKFSSNLKSDSHTLWEDVVGEKTNLDVYLEEQLKDSKFVKKFEESQRILDEKIKD